jgi:hypothetical protein
MKNKIVIMLAVVAAIGCSNKEEAVENLDTVKMELDTTKVEVENTKAPDYVEYRKQWIRTNSNLTDGYTLVDGRITKETVELNLDDLPFARAFRIEYLAKGEGNTFWWKGNEYTTNIARTIQQIERTDD